MFMFLIGLCIIGYGLSRLGKLAKDHPDKALQAASLLRQVLRK